MTIQAAHNHSPSAGGAIPAASSSASSSAQTFVPNSALTASPAPPPPLEPQRVEAVAALLPEIEVDIVIDYEDGRMQRLSKKWPENTNFEALKKHYGLRSVKPTYCDLLPDDFYDSYLICDVWSGSGVLELTALNLPRGSHNVPAAGPLTPKPIPQSDWVQLRPTFEPIPSTAIPLGSRRSIFLWIPSTTIDLQLKRPSPLGPEDPNYFLAPPKHTSITIRVHEEWGILNNFDKNKTLKDIKKQNNLLSSDIAIGSLPPFNRHILLPDTIDVECLLQFRTSIAPVPTKPSALSDIDCLPQCQRKIHLWPVESSAPPAIAQPSPGNIPFGSAAHTASLSAARLPDRSILALQAAPTALQRKQKSDWVAIHFIAHIDNDTTSSKIMFILDCTIAELKRLPGKWHLMNSEGVYTDAFDQSSVKSLFYLFTNDLIRLHCFEPASRQNRSIPPSAQASSSSSSSSSRPRALDASASNSPTCNTAPGPSSVNFPAAATALPSSPPLAPITTPTALADRDAANHSPSPYASTAPVVTPAQQAQALGASTSNPSSTTIPSQAPFSYSWPDQQNPHAAPHTISTDTSRELSFLPGPSPHRGSSPKETLDTSVPSSGPSTITSEDSLPPLHPLSQTQEIIAPSQSGNILNLTANPETTRSVSSSSEQDPLQVSPKASPRSAPGTPPPALIISAPANDSSHPKALDTAALTPQDPTGSVSPSPDILGPHSPRASTPPRSPTNRQPSEIGRTRASSTSSSQPRATTPDSPKADPSLINSYSPSLLKHVPAAGHNPLDPPRTPSKPPLSMDSQTLILTILLALGTTLSLIYVTTSLTNTVPSFLPSLLDLNKVSATTGLLTFSTFALPMITLTGAILYNLHKKAQETDSIEDTTTAPQKSWYARHKATLVVISVAAAVFSTAYLIYGLIGVVKFYSLSAFQLHGAGLMAPMGLSIGIAIPLIIYLSARLSSCRTLQPQR